VQPDPTLRVALSLNALVLVALGLYWGPLLGWCRQAFVG
jgi:NADH-quinone oxidoreductase subunit N